MWNVQEARLRAEVVYRQEQLLRAVADERRARQAVRRSEPADGSLGPPAWRRWLARPWLAPTGPVVEDDPMGHRPRVRGVEDGRQAG